jgi:Zn-finger nucleic acid-binding protein
MKCPACGNVLQKMTVEDVSVDVCRGGCGGIWFDAHELRKFDEPHEAGGEALLDIERNENIHVAFGKKRHCPKDSKVVLTRRFFNAEKHVEIDECPNCGGVWLDYGELEEIRKLPSSPGEQEKTVQEHLQKILGPDHAAPAGAGAPDTTRRLSRVFRFLSPRHRSWG